MEQEFKEASKQKTADTGITLIPNENNLFAWRAVIKVGLNNKPHNSIHAQSAGVGSGLVWHRYPCTTHVHACQHSMAKLLRFLSSTLTFV